MPDVDAASLGAGSTYGPYLLHHLYHHHHDHRHHRYYRDLFFVTLFIFQSRLRRREPRVSDIKATLGADPTYELYPHHNHHPHHPSPPPPLPPPCSLLRHTLHFSSRKRQWRREARLPDVDAIVGAAPTYGPYHHHHHHHHHNHHHNHLHHHPNHILLFIVLLVFLYVVSRETILTSARSRRYLRCRPDM